jgi:DNA-directed RNA polymerase specialized sigma24 family protein
MTEDANAHTTKLLRALLALAVDEREERLTANPGARKTELILDAAGLDSSEIAALTGKQAGSVRMALSRARKGGQARWDSGDG